MTTRYRAFTVKYIGPSNVKGSRIAIHDTRHGQRVYIPYNSEGPTQSSDQAKDWLESKGIPITGEALTDALPYFVLLSENFDRHIK